MSLIRLDIKSSSFDCKELVEVLDMESIELSVRLLFGVDTEMTIPFLSEVLRELGVRV